MRVEVDRDRCEGNAVCVGIAPDLFELDDDDYVVVTADPIPADAEERGRAGDRRVPPGRPDPQRLEVFVN